MLKKAILLLLICSVTIAGFAQKSKKKSPPKAPKNTYIEMLIDGETTPKERYCPNDSILFDFAILDTTITINKYCWWNDYLLTNICDSTPVAFSFPIPEKTNRVSLVLEIEIPTDTVPLKDTLTLITEIFVDHIRTFLDTTVCEGRDITVINSFGELLTFTNVQGDIWTNPDTLPSVSGCDSLVRWHITMNPFIREEHEISSCDSVIWGDTIVRRPPNCKKDTTITIERICYANDPDISCDTLKVLKITIIDTAQLSITFDDFCAGDDMGGDIILGTNFTAFDWIYYKDANKEIDTTFTVYEKNIFIDNPGYYIVIAYMDTSLYEILGDLRIVNCFDVADTTVGDCPLVIPNVITPGIDNHNDILGIKKLNPNRENELTIYDRWGKNVFHQKNYKCIFKGGAYLNIEDAFDGRSRGGQKLPDGTYYYAFKYASIPKSKTYTGIIMILNEQ